MIDLSSTFPNGDDVCPHQWDESVMRTPAGKDVVYKDDCAYCCRTCKGKDGIYVCMSCFVGVCREHMTKHMSLHASHVMYTMIKELPPAPKAPEEDAVKDTNLLGVVAAPEYDTHIVCGACCVELTPGVGCTFDSFQSLVSVTSAGVQETVNAKAHANEKMDCPHIASLIQSPNPFGDGISKPLPPMSGKEPCSMCPHDANNWMCMTCGAVGCPRTEAGGKEHAIMHNIFTQHPVVFKIGTIQNGLGDLYCYACGDSVHDFKFREHMAHFGVDVTNAVKTAKTLGEMEYDRTAQHDFNSVTEAGSTLTPKYGPGFTGLRNFGNTCYMASVLQCLFALKPMMDRFGKGWSHRATCVKDPLVCHECQMEKLCTAMTSSSEFSQASNAEYENAVTPRSFKRVFAKEHPMFSTGDQQDAAEYLQFLLKEVHRHIGTQHSTTTDPTTMFDFVVEQRSQCDVCNAVKYTQRVENILQLQIPIAPTAPPPANATAEEIDQLRPRTTLDACLESFLAPSSVECRCANCKEASVYRVSQRLKTFPDVIVMNPRREYFDRETLTVRKLDVYVDVPTDHASFECLRASEAQPDEVRIVDELPVSKQQPQPTKEVDEVALATVMSLGIDLHVAKWALSMCDCNVDRAIDYVFSHPEGPPSDISGATSETTSSATTATTSAASDGKAEYKLKATIMHFGASATTGHYVCYVHDDATNNWILFNDEKVVISHKPELRLASILFYVRCA